MKTKSILLAVFLLGLVAFFVTSKVVNNPVEATSESTQTVKEARQIAPLFQTTCLPGGFRTALFNLKNPSTLTSESNFGTSNPQLISDTVAYTMVLRLINSHGNDTAQIKRLRGYVEQNLGITDPSDIVAVFRLASDFKQRLRAFDNQITEIKDRYHALGHPPFSQTDQQRLERLKQDKERAVDNLIAEIPQRMSANGRNQLNQGIQERVKPKIRMQHRN